MKTRDRWAEWLAVRRHGGDEEARCAELKVLTRYRDRVLDNAALSEGETLLDVGCGEGLIAFGALDRGADTVVFTDISRDLLDVCRTAAAELGVLEQSRFLRASADDLRGVAEGSVDIVTTRSVLIYVADKQSAFREFARVLRPGGRISLFEPINRFAQRDGHTWAGYDLSPMPEIAAKIRAVYDAIQPLDSDPMLDFDERDLIALAERAGFFPVHLHLEAEIVPSEPRPWDSFLHSSGNPRIPTVAEAMEDALNPGEQERLVDHLRPLVEEGRGTWRMASTYLWATRSDT